MYFCKTIHKPSTNKWIWHVLSLLTLGELIALTLPHSMLPVASVLLRGHSNIISCKGVGGGGSFDFFDKVWQGVGGLLLQGDVPFSKELDI